MISYYTMESVRDLINGNYDIRQSKENSAPIPSWNRCPCKRFKNCRKGNCVGYVNIYVNTETVRWIFLEICYFKEKQRAFIRVNCTQMQKLFELGIINRDAPLAVETF
jgi:hypothetical protein